MEYLIAKKEKKEDLFDTIMHNLPLFPSISAAKLYYQLYTLPFTINLNRSIYKDLLKRAIDFLIITEFSSDQ